MQHETESFLPIAQKLQRPIVRSAQTLFSFAVSLSVSVRCSSISGPARNGHRLLYRPSANAVATNNGQTGHESITPGISRADRTAQGCRASPVHRQTRVAYAKLFQTPQSVGRIDLAL